METDLQENIQLKIKEIISEITEVDSQAIKQDSHLVQDLGADSMAALELMATLERKFEIVIDPENLPEMVTLEKINELVTRILSSAENG